MAILHPRSSILDLLSSRLFEALDGVDVVRGIFEPRFHGVDAYVGRAELFPSINLLSPYLSRAFPEGNPSFDPNTTWIAPRFSRIGTDFFNRRPATIVGSQLRKPAVAEPGQTAQCTVVSASEPDWNRLLNRQRS